MARACGVCENYVEVTVALGECHACAPAPLVEMASIREIESVEEMGLFAVVRWPRVAPEEHGCAEFRRG